MLELCLSWLTDELDAVDFLWKAKEDVLPLHERAVHTEHFRSYVERCVANSHVAIIGGGLSLF